MFVTQAYMNWKWLPLPLMQAGEIPCVIWTTKVQYISVCLLKLALEILNFLQFTQKWSGWISDSYCSSKPLWSGTGEVVMARTSPTPHPPYLPLCCNYPVWKCPSASIGVDLISTLRELLKCLLWQLMHWDTTIDTGNFMVLTRIKV